ncbi:hypothetical protein PSJ8397_02187 [Pseudooctadecabacter jejudonensis]|uniref:DUF2946 domain-containing protein n=2 Tax=Pseudooctadecabacter jejudonensis TaxID=1391910 RepID=A0A1Y5SL54_9RHOB|nr:hypothetical protein PSJ8397_02187 [Pseudooctadecabacter jejudonensis]
MRCILFGLALLIAGTSQHMAVARGVMKDAAGQIVLCTGHGVQVVTVDHQGQPMEAVQICPDCALTALADTRADVKVAVSADLVWTLVAVEQGPHETRPVVLSPSARGPPVLI